MHKISIILFATAALACPAVKSAQKPYDQCGGVNWQGGTTCVTGWTCVYENPYYSQCLQVESTSTTTITSTTTTTSTIESTSPSVAESTTVIVIESTTPVAIESTSPAAPESTTPAAAEDTSQSTSASPSTSASQVAASTPEPSSSSSSNGTSYKSSFTWYGAGDGNGSPNCNTNTAACGFYTSPGYSVAASQNLYGAPPGAGAGSACGTCWKLVGETDSNGKTLSNAGTSIVVMINNLCPAEGNPLCAQDGLSGTNQYGANVNFDLCVNSGARDAFFGDDGTGFAVGTATEVDCSEWSGTIQH